MAGGSDSVGKLVRDKIPELIRASGRIPEVRRLASDEYAHALYDKLVEEVAELRDACTSREALEEAADVLEVLLGIVKVHGYAMEDVVEAADVKRQARGAFEKRLWLDRAGD